MLINFFVYKVLTIISKWKSRNFTNKKELAWCSGVDWLEKYKRKSTSSQFN